MHLVSIRPKHVTNFNNYTGILSVRSVMSLICIEVKVLFEPPVYVESSTFSMNTFTNNQPDFSSAFCSNTSSLTSAPIISPSLSISCFNVITVSSLSLPKMMNLSDLEIKLNYHVYLNR